MARQNTVRKDMQRSGPWTSRPLAGQAVAGQALAGLDRLIYEPIRLRIVSALAVNGRSRSTS